MKILLNPFHVFPLLAALILASLSHAQEKTNTELSSQIIGTWDVVIENVNEVIYLRIEKVTTRAKGEYTLDAAYGWPSRERPVQAAELIQSDKDVRLSFTARNGGKAAAILSPDGSFVGTWDYKSNPTRAIRVVKLKESDIRSTPVIETVSADVPKECAAFLGGWTGTWNRSGQAWLWVTSIDAKCVAKYAYESAPYPRSFKAIEIKDGVLVATNSFGANNFRVDGGGLQDRWVGNNGNSDTLAFNPVDRMVDPVKTAAQTIVKPAADVPSGCAAFSGRWTGTWGHGIGQLWLWVASVDSKCVAKIAYLANSDTPSSFQTLEIKDGTLSIVCGGTDTCKFHRQGDELWAAAYGAAGANNNAVFKQIR